MNSKTTPAIMKMVVKLIVDQWAVGSGQWAASYDWRASAGFWVDVISIASFHSAHCTLHTAHFLTYLARTTVLMFPRT